MRNFRIHTRFLPLLALALFLPGCSDIFHKKDEKNQLPLYMLYSPNGEPLNGGRLGRPTCEQALGGWFDRTAGSPTGSISKAVFLTDAELQFHRMDIDHQGYLVSEELDRYRAPYRQQEVALPKPEGDDSEKKGRHKGNKKSRSDSHGNPMAHLSDPVMSADTNLDFQVTLSEFMLQAGDNFGKLDSNRNGSLSKDEVLAACKPEEKP